MTVTRYKRDRSAEVIRDAVMGVVRHKREARPAEPAKPAAAAEPADALKARSAEDLTGHYAEVVAPMRINANVLARAKRKTRSADGQGGIPASLATNLFKTYDPPPGVLPKDATPDMAMDAGLQSWAESSFTNAWNFANPLGSSFAEGIGFLGYAYLSQLTERPEYRRISERIAIEMTRKWIRLTVSGEADPEKTEDDADAKANDGIGFDRQPDADLDDEDADADGAPAGGAVADDEDDEPTPEEKAQKKRNEALQKKLKEIDADMKRLDVRGKFKTIAEFDGWMGRSHLYIDTGDSDDPEELKTNLGNGSDEISKDKFKKGSLRNIKNIEAIWCYPVNYNANDPLADDWYNPQLWFAMAKQIHVSRLLTFVGRPLPDILKPAYAFGGLSMSQMAKPYVDNWLRTRQAVTNLIESFSVSGVYTNAQSLLQGGGDEVLDRIEMFNGTRSNLGSMVLDKETEEFFNISTPLGTLDHLQAQSQEAMSSVSGIPLIVLLGITPSGLNASSEGELRVFYDLIHAMQENLFRDKLKRVIDFIQLHLYGEVDPAIGFEFEPLWSLDEKGEAEVRKIKAETHMIYVDGGIIGQEEVRNIEIEDDNSPYNGLDPDDMPDLQAEEDAGLVPGGGSSEGGEGGSGRADNKEVDGAADAAFNEEDHPRDSDGKFGNGTGGTTVHSSDKPYQSGLKAFGLDHAEAQKKEWRKAAPKTIDDLISSSPENQNALASICDKAAEAVGTEFKNPGVKSKKRLVEKIEGGRKPENITDAVRGGFNVDSPEDGDRIVHMLATKFEVADEGWQKNAAGYFDRKTMVRFPDGQVGEIQMWPPGMLEAKENGGGHRLYEKWRSLDPNSTEAASINQQMVELYAKVEEALPASWKSLFRKSG